VKLESSVEERKILSVPEPYIPLL